MRKYQPKQHGCPYRSNDGKCTHKGHYLEKEGKKCYCGYNSPEQCENYLEWVELVNLTTYDESSLGDPLKRKFKWYKKR